MTIKHLEIIKKVQRWITYADEDLRLAKHGLTIASSCPYRLIAYHAQQCAEKYLKAWLVFKQIDFPYTHNIRSLLQLCLGEWTAEIADADQLTPFAVTTRYPGEDERVTRVNALNAIELAKKVRKVVRRAFKEEGFIH
ncbi:MAG TPA: HEPN domain-containing protein [Candidatus Kapabacteria bacterium]|nr:HEPN domain-containing protein [Candidatus Kapabacteria bacterium]